MQYLETFITACKVRFIHLADFIHTFFCYYVRKPRFFLADLLILMQYFFESPFHMINQYDKKHTKHPLGPYGETSFKTLSELLNHFEIPPSASIADIGSGRGRASFFLRLVRGHPLVRGVEYYGKMVSRAERVCQLLHIDGLSFIRDDWASCHLNNIDVIYIYAIITEDHSWSRLAHHLSSLPSGTKVITISSWLGDVLPTRFRLEKTVPITFDWGETEAFLQTVIP